MPVIGYIGNAKPAAIGMTAFRQGLSEAGYVEGQNLTIEFGWAEGHTAGARISRPTWYAVRSA